MKTSRVRLTFIVTQPSDSVLVTITGQVNTDLDIDLGYVTAKSSWSKISNTGMKGSPARLAWEYLLEISRSILAKSTRYLTK